jgi:hypothetical protein
VEQVGPTAGAAPAVCMMPALRPVHHVAGAQLVLVISGMVHGTSTAEPALFS